VTFPRQRWLSTFADSQRTPLKPTCRATASCLALFHCAEFAFEPRPRLCASHWIGLAAIRAAKHFLACPLFQHQFHAFLALWTGGRIRLDLGHNASLDQAGACSTLSHR
jgi:hypothetical protein